MKAALSFAALLAGCSQQSSPPPTNQSAAAASAPATKPAELQARPFVHDEKNDLIEFHYGWSAEAAAVPQLVERFRTEMKLEKEKLIAGAKEDKSVREKEGFDFNGYMLSTDYETAGQSDRLLSLRVDVGSYTGGAHGNYGTNALLWDRSEAREISVDGLFAERANMSRLLAKSWCDALNKAREEKRGEPVGRGGMFDDCPKLSEIAVIPTDKNGNGRFETLTFVASPYVAGPYAEGSYEIEMAVTADLIASLSSDFQPSFEAGQPQ